MAGILSFKTNAAAAQRRVVVPKTGKIAKTNPKATLKESFCGVTPCFKRSSKGWMTFTWKNPSVFKRWFGSKIP